MRRQKTDLNDGHLTSSGNGDMPLSADQVVRESANRISKRPGYCGGRACIRDTRMPVWTVINCYQLGGDDGSVRIAYPDLTAEDLTAAKAYYGAHKAEIDADIRENEEGEEGLAE